jgi:hypothetical protein
MAVRGVKIWLKAELNALTLRRTPAPSAVPEPVTELRK